MAEPWEESLEVIQAKFNAVEAEELIQSSQALAFKQEQTIADLEEQINLLKSKQSEAKQQRIIARRLVSDAEKKKQAAEQLIEDAKKAWEARQAAESAQAELVKGIEKFAWYSGITDGRGQTQTVKQHQIDGAVFIATNRNVILGDSMGVGKSLTALAALDLFGAKSAIFIAPADVAENLEAECNKWSPHRVVLNITGKTKIERNAMINALTPLKTFGASSLIVLNYEAWRKDHNLLRNLLKYMPEAVVMDEAHNIKETTTSAYQGCMRLCHEHNACQSCGKYMEPSAWGVKCADCGNNVSTSSVRMIVPMTGTPILNKPQDLFALLSIIDPVAFGSKNRFLNNYCSQDYNGNWKFSGIDRLMERLKGRILRRTLKDVGVFLADPILTVHNVEITEDNYPRQRKVIDSLEQNASIVLNRVDEFGNPVAINVIEKIALITRLRQAACYPAGIQIKDDLGNIVLSVGEDVQESAKIDKALQIIIEAVEDGRRVTLFSQFKGALASLEDQLNLIGIRAVRLDGETSKATRSEIKANFDKSRGEEPKWDVVLANYKTGGVGLNFTACTVLITLDEEWNDGKKQQGLARVQRIGQDEQVFFHEIVAVGTMDEWMRTLIENKKAMAESFNEMQAEQQQAIMDELIMNLRKK